MDDVLRYHIIPYAPIEFLDVCEWTRELALGYLSYVGVKQMYGEYYCQRLSCRYGLYYRIVRLLGAAERFADVSTFTCINYDDIYFGIRVWRLLQEGDKATVFSFYKYIKYHAYRVDSCMVDIFKLRFGRDDMEKMKDYFSDYQYSDIKNYYKYNAIWNHEASYHGKFWRLRKELEKYNFPQ